MGVNAIAVRALDSRMTAADVVFENFIFVVCIFLCFYYEMGSYMFVLFFSQQMIVLSSICNRYQRRYYPPIVVNSRGGLYELKLM